MNKKVKEILIPTVVLFCIAAGMALLLGLTNMLTADKIAERQKQAESEAVQKVVAADTFETKTITVDGNEQAYFIGKKGDQIVGYAVTLSSNGYGGSVTTVIGLDPTGKITGVEVSDVANETPGLGQNAKKENFTNQFKGKSGTLSVVKNSAGEQEVNAVTGATITSTAVTNNVNNAIKIFEAIVGGEPNGQAE